MSKDNKDVKDRGLLITIGTVIPSVAIVCTLLWNTYAQPKVDATIAAKIKPIQEKVDSLYAMVIQLQNTDKKFVFHNQQMIFLLKRLAGKKAVKEMEEETEIFKPK